MKGREGDWCPPHDLFARRPCTFPPKLESWRLNTQSLRNPVLVFGSIEPRIQTSSVVSLVDGGF